MDTFNGQQDQKDNGLSEERRMSKLKDKLEH